MKKLIHARSLSVLKVVDTTTVGRFQIDAMMFVHMALCLHFKKKYTMVRTKPGRPDLAHAQSPIYFSIQITIPARSVLKAADQVTAMIKKTDALTLAHMDLGSYMMTTLLSMAKKYYSDGADVMT